MPSWLPSVPYPPAKEGYWQPITSTLDWCEENYYATSYSAEIVNTLTNLLFLYLGAKGAYNCWTQGHDRIFLISFLGYLVVGSGSFLFHSTLKYPMQLVDELSMIYTTCIMCYATFGYGKESQFKRVLLISLIGLAAFITMYYHYLEDPTFHQITYALLTTVVLTRAIWIMEVNIRPRYRHKRQKRWANGSVNGQALHNGAVNGHANGSVNGHANGHANGNAQVPKTVLDEDQRDLATLKVMWVMIGYGLTVFLGGFLMWNLDNIYCSKFRAWRHELGLPWGLLLEGHGWWHVMTGIGAYFYIVWGIWLRHHLNGTKDQVELRWPRLMTSMPEIVRVDGKKVE